jgi:hypothetical protein
MKLLILHFLPIMQIRPILTKIDFQNSSDTTNLKQIWSESSFGYVL